jgi:hypothetical protein
MRSLYNTSNVNDFAVFLYDFEKYTIFRFFSIEFNPKGAMKVWAYFTMNIHGAL